MGPMKMRGGHVCGADAKNDAAIFVSQLRPQNLDLDVGCELAKTAMLHMVWTRAPMCVQPCGGASPSRLTTSSFKADSTFWQVVAIVKPQPPAQDLRFPCEFGSSLLSTLIDWPSCP